MAHNTTDQRSDIIIFQGDVTEALPNTMFRVVVQEGPAELIGKTVLCTLNGKMRRYRIRVLPGDPVIAEMSLYDLGKARITRRLREGQSVNLDQQNQDQESENENE